MITDDCLDRVLPVVADSWEQLRGCDVYRLLNSINYESKESLGKATGIVMLKRPDLSDRIQEASREILLELEDT